MEDINKLGQMLKYLNNRAMKFLSILTAQEIFKT